ncbi:hypothetical protein J7354_01540 [Sulfitobacter sp. R18_2]|uniref:hypothetical protein n=1 Tax=Sulfitobacter sp. R18_2 TaxID=2821105 RepID=UPI001ADBCECD|nr:hypothetical protein [Sulfitobacter sp. R18_2]MBO9437333.1 hypothetical protein [Sulfitobacter sp. R18_2]
MNTLVKISKRIILASVLIFALVIFLAVADEPEDEVVAQAETSEPEEETGDNILSKARYACMSVIEENLNDPDSAEWGIWSDNPYQTWPASMEGDVVTVEPTFRAKNGFGALSLNSFICKIDTSGEWSLLELREL